jgi:hypothetical protein
MSVKEGDRRRRARRRPIFAGLLLAVPFASALGLPACTLSTAGLSAGPEAGGPSGCSDSADPAACEDAAAPDAGDASLAPGRDTGPGPGPDAGATDSAADEGDGAEAEGEAGAGTTDADAGPPAVSIVLSGSQTAPVAGNAYVLQADEWNSTAPLTIASDGNVDFHVTVDGLSNVVPGAPGAYPSFYKGCHWGSCSTQSGLPLPVTAIEAAGTVTTSIDCTNNVAGAWDNSYDVWFNAAASTSDNGTNGLEMMIWLANSGGTQPAGGEVATGVSIAGHTFDVWYSGTGGTSSPLLSYQLVTAASSFTNLDIGALAQDAVSRGYLPASYYLLDVEAGFELWDGGVGLAVNSFSVTVN